MTKISWATPLLNSTYDDHYVCVKSLYHDSCRWMWRLLTDHINWSSIESKKRPEKHSWNHGHACEYISFRTNKIRHVYFCISHTYKHLLHFRTSHDGFRSPPAASIQAQPLIMNLSKVIYKLPSSTLTTYSCSVYTVLSWCVFHHQQQQGRCENLKILNRRETHTWVERLRRSELRELFDKLHVILQTNHKPPRLHLLSMVSFS